MITKKIAWGANWSVYANRSEDVDKAAQYKMLGDMVANRFNEIARKNNCHVTWIPQAGEVIGPYDLNLDSEGENRLEEWRKQAEDEIGKEIKIGLKETMEGMDEFIRSLIEAHGVEFAQGVLCLSSLASQKETIQ